MATTPKVPSAVDVGEVMTADPKPGVARSETFSVATANGPVVAEMLASVGFGPRWKGLAWAWAAVGAAVMASAASAATAAARTARRRGARDDGFVIGVS